MPLHKKEIMHLSRLVHAYVNRDHPVVAPEKQAEILTNPCRLQQLIDIVKSLPDDGLDTPEKCDLLLDRLEAALNDPHDDTPDD